MILWYNLVNCSKMCDDGSASVQSRKLEGRRASYDWFWEVIKQLECDGNENVTSGKSVVRLMIQKDFYNYWCYSQANMLAIRIIYNCKGLGSFEYSKAVAECYIDKLYQFTMAWLI